MTWIKIINWLVHAKIINCWRTEKGKDFGKNCDEFVQLGRRGLGKYYLKLLLIYYYLQEERILFQIFMCHYSRLFETRFPLWHHQYTLLAGQRGWGTTHDIPLRLRVKKNSIHIVDKNPYRFFIFSIIDKNGMY